MLDKGMYKDYHLRVEKVYTMKRTYTWSFFPMVSSHDCFTFCSWWVGVVKGGHARTLQSNPCPVSFPATLGVTTPWMPSPSNISLFMPLLESVFSLSRMGYLHPLRNSLVGLGYDAALTRTWNCSLGLDDMWWLKWPSPCPQPCLAPEPAFQSWAWSSFGNL